MISVQFRQATTIAGTTYPVGAVATLDNAIAHDLVLSQTAKMAPRDFFPGPFSGGANAGSTVANIVTSSGVLAAGKHTPIDCTSGPKSMTLPTVTGNGIIISLEKIDFTAAAITVSGNLRGAFGSLTLTLPRETLVLLSRADGSWWPTAGQKTKISLDSTYAAIGSTVGGGGNTGNVTGQTVVVTDPNGTTTTTTTTTTTGGTTGGTGSTTVIPSVGDGTVHIDSNDTSILVLEDGGPWVTDSAHPSRVLVSSTTWQTDPQDPSVVIVNYTPVVRDGTTHIDTSDKSILVLEDGGPWTSDPYHPSRVIVTSSTWSTDPFDPSIVLAN